MKKFNLVCIIDDDPIFLMMAEKMMGTANFSNQLIVFRNGKEALDNLKPKLEDGKNLPDIIFLDLNMPVLDGWQFLDQFSQIPTSEKIYVYILTSSIDPEDIKKADKYDVVYNFLQKPISVAKFQEILGRFQDKL